MPLADASQYPLWLNVLIFAAAGVVVWIAGTRLAGYVDGISSRTGLGQAFAGMLLLGGITSLPELANTITASATGNPALAINNLLGSAAINIFLLAVADAVVGRDAVTSVVAKPSTLMMSVLCILVLVAVAVAIVTGDTPVFGVGLWGVGLAAVSIGAFWLASGFGERSTWEAKEKNPEEEEEDAEASKSLRSLVLKTLLAGAAIFAAGYTLSQTGDALAEQTGLGSGMVGFLLIGLATSLPELSTITEAMRRRRYELAFGQALGTNFVNLSMIAVSDLVFAGGAVINALGSFEVLLALLGALLVGIYLVGLLERRDATVLRMGYDSLAVIVLFLGGAVVLFLDQPA